MSSKLRINGETIDSGKMYSGGHVLELLKVSFNNGITHANAVHSQERKVIYEEGYRAGYDAASEDLNSLRSLLRKILKEEDNDE